jgi:hypothetical protein
MAHNQSDPTERKLLHKYSADELGVVRSVARNMGTEATDAEVIDEAYGFGMGEPQARRVLDAYKELSTMMVKWLDTELL